MDEMNAEEKQFDISSLPFITQSRLASYVSEDVGARIFIQNGIEPMLQNGPKCGLVALSTSLKSFGVNVTIEEIFNEAVSRKYTKQGEMFSALNLSNLANHFFPGSSIVRNSFPTFQEIVEAIQHGFQFFVPYDCDKNFGPAQHNGHKAHWLLLCGFFVTSSNVSGFVAATTSNIPDSDSKSLFLLGYQGKSKTLGIFNYEELIESNSQLFEAGPIRGTDEYAIENVNDLSDLRGKIVRIGNCVDQ